MFTFFLIIRTFYFVRASHYLNLILFLYCTQFFYGIFFIQTLRDFSSTCFFFKEFHSVLLSNKLFICFSLNRFNHWPVSNRIHRIRIKKNTIYDTVVLRHCSLFIALMKMIVDVVSFDKIHIKIESLTLLLFYFVSFFLSCFEQNTCAELLQ